CLLASRHARGSTPPCGPTGRAQRPRGQEGRTRRRPRRRDQDGPPLPVGRNVLTVEIAESYADWALKCAESTSRPSASWWRPACLISARSTCPSRRRRFRGLPPKEVDDNDG